MEQENPDNQINIPINRDKDACIVPNQERRCANVVKERGGKGGTWKR